MGDQIHVTVIATGFAMRPLLTEEESSRKEKLPTFRREAITIHNTVNAPAHEAKKSEEAESPVQPKIDPVIFKDDDLEIPAFLRQRHQ